MSYVQRNLLKYDYKISTKPSLAASHTQFDKRLIQLSHGDVPQLTLPTVLVDTHYKQSLVLFWAVDGKPGDTAKGQRSSLAPCSEMLLPGIQRSRCSKIPLNTKCDSWPALV